MHFIWLRRSWRHSKESTAHLFEGGYVWTPVEYHVGDIILVQEDLAKEMLELAIVRFVEEFVRKYFLGKGEKTLAWALAERLD